MPYNLSFYLYTCTPLVDKRNCQDINNSISSNWTTEFTIYTKIYTPTLKFTEKSVTSKLHLR